MSIFRLKSQQKGREGGEGEQLCLKKPSGDKRDFCQKEKKWHLAESGCPGAENEGRVN